MREIATVFPTTVLTTAIQREILCVLGVLTLQLVSELEVVKDPSAAVPARP